MSAIRILSVYLLLVTSLSCNKESPLCKEREFFISQPNLNESLLKPFEKYINTDLFYPNYFTDTCIKLEDKYFYLYHTSNYFWLTGYLSTDRNGNILYVPMNDTTIQFQILFDFSIGINEFYYTCVARYKFIKVTLLDKYFDINNDSVHFFQIDKLKDLIPRIYNIKSRIDIRHETYFIEVSKTKGIISYIIYIDSGRYGKLTVIPHLSFSILPVDLANKLYINSKRTFSGEE